MVVTWQREIFKLALLKMVAFSEMMRRSKLRRTNGISSLVLLT